MRDIISHVAPIYAHNDNITAHEMRVSQFYCRMRFGDTPLLL